MFSFVRKRIGIKLSIIIAIIVSSISLVFSMYLNNLNLKKLEMTLTLTINKTADFADLSYSDLMWKFDDEGTQRLTEGILNTAEIVAINLYDKDKFIIGYKNDINNSDFIKVKLEEPYVISIDDKYIKKISREIIFDENILGHYELFYTNKFIIETGQEAKFMAIPLLLILAAVIVIIINFAANFLVIRPIINLAKTTKKIAENRDYSIEINRKGDDEISELYTAFNEMIMQINDKELEREKLYSELKQSEKNYRYFFEKLQLAINDRKYDIIEQQDFQNIELVESLNNILRTLDSSTRETIKQDWIKTGQTQLSQKISGERKLNDICLNTITYVAKHISAQVGTIYIFDPSEELYKLIASYAFKERKGFTNTYKAGEGLLGQVALEKQRILFSEIPENYINIESSLGNTAPKHLLVFPLIYENECKGVIELGSVSSFTQVQIEFCDTISRIIAVAINAAQFNEQLKILFEKTKEQSEELKTQQEELQITNSELEEQTEKLKTSKEKLQIQQEELQASNEEMEEKNEMLESQKEEIEKKNRTLKIQQKEVVEKARQLELATKYKSEFLANMSHELRTPLNSLLLLSKMLTDNEEKNLTEDQIDSASSIYRSGKNLLYLINDILDLSKIEAKKIELDISKIKISNLVLDLQNEFKHIAIDKGLEFVTEIEDDVPERMSTDIHRLEQIIRNLVSNALKFTETGSVSIYFKKPDPSIVFERNDLIADSTIAISVEDTGYGIPEDKQKLIFEAFKQVDGSISRLHGGTGLGLSISKELAHLLGGEIQLKSTFGSGSAFTIYLPVIGKLPVNNLKENDEENAAERIEPNLKSETPPKNISPAIRQLLIIEDDSEFANTIAKLSKSKGYENIITHDGETGIKYAHEKNPDGIILDIGLPGIDGWKVLNELKTNPATRHIPVHIISGLDDAKDGLLKGAVGFLHKPVSMEELSGAFNKIEEIVNRDVKKLLVIEDDKDLRQTILKLMASQDIETVSTSTGKESLEILKSGKFDCVILDLGLPDISGFDLLDEIEKEIGENKPPIIIYTGRDLTSEETDKLKQYSESIVLKNAASFDRLLDETSLFMHRVESDLPESQQEMLLNLREKESVLLDKKVLIVDDDMRNAFALNKFLKGKGMIPNIANNGKKALEILETNEKPDIILMDIMMPLMDGYETIRRIRKQVKFKDVPILALTAKAMNSDRKQCIEAGANDYLTKPVDIPKLLSMLRIWLY